MIERIATWTLAAALVAAFVSPTIAGLCGRAALALPLYWCGLMTEAELSAFALDFHF